MGWDGAHSALIIQARAVLTLIVVKNLLILESPDEIESAGHCKSTTSTDNKLWVSTYRQGRLVHSFSLRPTT